MPSTVLYRLIYRSQVAKQVRFEDAEAIAVHSAQKNQSVGVTGLLVYTPSHFLQVLEGERKGVEAVFKRLETDERHLRVTTLALGPIAERAFGDWGMRATLPIGALGAKAIEALDGEAALALLLSLRPK